MINSNVLAGARCGDRIGFKQNCTIDLVREQKANRAYICADIEPDAPVQMSAKELDVLRARHTVVEQTRRHIRVGVGNKAERIVRSNNERHADDALPQLPPNKDQDSLGSFATVRRIAPNGPKNVDESFQ